MFRGFETESNVYPGNQHDLGSEGFSHERDWTSPSFSNELEERGLSYKIFWTFEGASQHLCTRAPPKELDGG